MKKALILALLLSPQLALGLGIAPGSSEHWFKPGVSQYEFTLFNDEGFEREVLLSLEGELARFANLSTSKLSFSTNDSEKSFRATLNLPQELKPGPHLLRIVAKDSERVSGEVTARVGVVAKLTVFYPYPESFIQAFLEKSELRPGREGVLVLKVENKGSTVENASAVLELYDSDELVARLRSSPATLNPGESAYLNAPWTPKQRGVYSLKARVLYSKEASLNSSVKVGERRILLNLTPEYLRNGVAALNLEFFNDWNTPLKGFHATASLGPAEAKTVVATIPPRQYASLKAYLPVKGLESGAYSLTVLAEYEGGAWKKSFNSSVGEDWFEVNGLRVSEGKARRGYLAALLVAALITAWLLKKRYSPRNRYRTEKFK